MTKDNLTVRERLIEKAKEYFDTHMMMPGIKSIHSAAVLMADFAIFINQLSNEALTLDTIEQSKEICGHCKHFETCPTYPYRYNKACNLFEKQIG